MSITVKPRIRFRSVTRTIRIDEDVDHSLSDLADREDLSVNQLVSMALRRYMEWELLADKMSIVDVTNSTLTKLFEKINANDARQLGRDAGNNAWTEIVTYLYKSLNYQNILKMLELRGHYGRGFIFEHSSDNNGDILIVKHHQGPNSTAFLSEAIAQLLKKANVKNEISETEDQIVIRTFLPVKPLKNNNTNNARLEKKLTASNVL